MRANPSAASSSTEQQPSPTQAPHPNPPPLAAGLSGEEEQVVRSSRRPTPDPPWPGLSRPPTSSLQPPPSGEKAWMAGTSAAKGSYGYLGRSNASHCVQQNFPRTALPF